MKAQHNDQQNNVVIVIVLEDLLVSIMSKSAKRITERPGVMSKTRTESKGDLGSRIV
jgi:hypothetical protein